MKPSRLVLVVPCYVEAARLQPAAFVDFLRSRPWASLLFVDDGSRDRTRDILTGLAAVVPDQADVLVLPSHAGKAEAVRQGVLRARTAGPDYVGYWDADLSTPLETADDFVALLDKRPTVDLVLGSRVMLMGRDIRRSARRHYVSRVFATFASLALALPVYDTQCGAKVLRATDEVLGLFRRPFRSAWIFDVELLARYIALPAGEAGPPRSARIYELSLPTWHESPGSKLRYADFLRSTIEVLGIWRERVTRGRRAEGRGTPKTANREGP